MVLFQAMRLVILLGWALWMIGCGGAPEGTPAGSQDDTVEPSRAAAAGGEAAAVGDGPPDVSDGRRLERFQVPVTGDRPSRGPDDALVTIVVISDFQCPFCARAVPTLEQLERTYGDDLRIVWRNNPLPFHRDAKPAATAAMEAYAQGGDAMFWRMHDQIFANAQDLSRGSLLELGRKVGMGVAALRRALDEGSHDDAIAEDQALAERLDLRGTPAFLVNGRKIMGAQPYVVFEDLVEDELRMARRLLDHGASRSAIYDHWMQSARAEAAQQRPEPAPPVRPAERPPERYELSVPRGAPRRGPGDAPVVIQVFSDFECPFCARAVPVLDRIRKEYGSQVAVVFRHYPLPFHANARMAHQAAAEVHRQGGDAKFWRYHDLLFDSRADLSREALERLARQVGGIKMGPFRRALEGGRHDATLQADIDAVAVAGVRIGTPSFFINGLLVQGARDFASFQTVIDGELESD
jgi:protein-disulfide isomerase